MKKIYLMSAMVIFLVSLSIAIYAHGSGNFENNLIEYEEMEEVIESKHMGMKSMMDGVDHQRMHEDMEEVFESGDIGLLEDLRDKYNMPVMRWVESNEDLELAKDMHQRFADKKAYGAGSGCHG